MVDKTPRDDGRRRAAVPSRRRFLVGAGGTVAATGLALGAHAAPEGAAGAPRPAASPERGGIEPFWGERQAGIVTPQQSHTYFAAFDLVSPKRDDLIKVLRSWTAAASPVALLFGFWLVSIPGRDRRRV